MNICFYTSENPSIANLLNIGYLVHSRPEHNYSFLNVVRKQHQQSLKDKLKKLYAELKYRDGRFDFEKDIAAINKKLQGHLVPVDKSKFPTAFADAVNDIKSEQFLKELKPDLIIQAGAGILKSNIFSLAARATINVHHGIAPEIRGIDSTFWCLYYGMKDKIGVTCHFIDETLDTGAVIVQEYLHTSATTFTDIQTENYLLGRDVLLKSVDIINKGDYTISPQGEVQSYYFGVVNPFQYRDLKRNNFQPITNTAGKAFKMKVKNIVMQ